jgi:hypothetical protein
MLGQAAVAAVNAVSALADSAFDCHPWLGIGNLLKIGPHG